MAGAGKASGSPELCLRRDPSWVFLLCYQDLSSTDGRGVGVFVHFHIPST